MILVEPYWWYVLFVRTNTEHKVVKAFNDFVQSSQTAFYFKLFVPETEKYYRSKANKRYGEQFLRHLLFSGYVFIETNMPSDKFKDFIATHLRNSIHIIKLLRYGNDQGIAVTFEERQKFECLFKGKRCVEHSKGYIEGEKIVITGGPLFGMESNIKRINRHNRSAIIELDMLNPKHMLQVALEIVDKR